MEVMYWLVGILAVGLLLYLFLALLRPDLFN